MGPGAAKSMFFKKDMSDTGVDFSSGGRKRPTEKLNADARKSKGISKGE